MTPPVAAPSSQPATQTPGVGTPGTPGNWARRVFGRPVINQDVQIEQKLSAKGYLSLDDIYTIWGLTKEHLKDLNIFNVTWEDGINAAELEELVKHQDQFFDEKFMPLLRGSGLGREKIRELFDRLWHLAATGKLDRSAWNELMEQYGLKGLEMNSASFSALLGGERGFSDDQRVESIIEFAQAISNLHLNMLNRHPRTGDPKKDLAQEKEYYKTLSELCKEKHFNIIYLDKWDKAVMQILQPLGKMSIDPSIDREELLRMIKDGNFGDTLKELADKTKSWREFLVKMLRYLEKAVSEGMHTKGMDSGQYYLSLSQRMGFVKTILDEGEGSGKWNAFIEQLSRIFKGKDNQVHFDYKKVKDGGV